jgi:hypothetical protein
MGDVKLRLTTRLERGGMFLFFALVLAGSMPLGVNAQAATHRAGLVVRFGDGGVVTRCVSFSESSLSGAELLGRSGLLVVLDLNSSIGAGVCKIGNQGCDRGKPCFCQCEGSTCAYWQYFHLQGGAWKYSNLGAGVYQVPDGAVEGWAWGNNVAPPVMSLDQICAASALVNVSPLPTRASTPTATLRSPTPTVSPTAVPVMISAASATAVAAVPATAVPSAIPSATVPPTSSPASQPTLPLASAQSSAATVAVSAQNAPITSPLAAYVIFGIIVLGLVAWLVMQRRKAR